MASHRTVIPSYEDLGRLCCEKVTKKGMDSVKYLTIIQVPVEKA